IRRAHQLHPGDAAQQLAIRFGEGDAAAARQPFVRQSGLAGVDDEHAVVGVDQSVDDRVPQPRAEGEQQHDRDGAPRDAEHREEGTHLLRLQVAVEFFEQDPPRRRAPQPPYRRHSTGSSAAALRAGSRPATSATSANNASAVAKTVVEICGVPTTSWIGNRRTTRISAAESRSPSAAPTATIRKASVMNWKRMSRRRAPNERFTPISRVRSLTTM